MDVSKLPTCLAPFLSMYVNSFRVGPCCEYLENETEISEPCIERWNDEIFKSYRKLHYEGNFDKLPQVCKQCINSQYSHRNHFLREYPYEFFDLKKYYNPETGYMDMDAIREVTIGFSNKCNLACITCSPKHSNTYSRIYNEKIITSDKKCIVRENFNSLEFIEKNISHLKTIFFHGGEPIMENDSYEVFNLIKKYKREDITVYFTTNGSMTKFPNGKSIFDTLNDLKNAKLILSLDALGEELHYVRYPITEGVVINFIKNLKEKCPDVVKLVHITLSNLTSISLLKFITKLDNLIEKKEIKIDHVSIHAVTGPDYYSPSNLPKNVKKILLEKLLSFILDRDKRGWPNWLKKEQVMKAMGALKINQSNEDLWQVFIKRHKKIDSIRNTSLIEIYPILESYIGN